MKKRFVKIGIIFAVLLIADAAFLNGFARSVAWTATRAATSYATKTMRERQKEFNACIRETIQDDDQISDEVPEPKFEEKPQPTESEIKVSIPVVSQSLHRCPRCGH